MKNTIILLLTVFLFSVACTDNDDDVGASIRIKNTSAINFDKVQVGDAQSLHANVAPNEYSEYLQYGTAYEYAYIKIESGSETYVLQPIDFVGEKPLTSGFYTYELNVTEGNVLLVFKTD